MAGRPPVQVGGLADRLAGRPPVQVREINGRLALYRANAQAADHNRHPAHPRIRHDTVQLIRRPPVVTGADSVNLPPLAAASAVGNATAQAEANVMRRRYPLRMRQSPLGQQVAALLGPSGSGGPGPSNALAIPAPVLPAPGEWNLGPLNNDTTVWITRHGGRYHRFYDCEGLANASVITPIRYGQMVRDTIEGEQVRPLCGYCETRLRLQRR